MERGTVKGAEHGLGADGSIGRAIRGRPLKRFESSYSLTIKWGLRTGGWPFWGREEAKGMLEVSVCRKGSVLTCALTRIKVVPRKFYALGFSKGVFSFQEEINHVSKLQG